jgi:tetratricopeptide (TPR) repeat protein
MIASAVNLHHFILDGAIWKLRDGPIARVLLRGATTEGSGAAAPGRGPRRLVWAAACTWLALQGLGRLGWELEVRPASEPLDPPRLERALERLRWIGWDDAELRLSLGIAAGERGDLAAARAQIERSLALEESARALVALAHLEFHARRPDSARAALERAVRSEPENPDAWASSAQVWQALGDPDPARRALEQALLLAPSREDLRRQLAALPEDADPGDAAH